MWLSWGKCPRPTLASISNARLRKLQLGSLEDAKQKKTIEKISPETDREETEKINEVEATEGKAPLGKKRKVGTQGCPKLTPTKLVGNGSSTKATPSTLTGPSIQQKRKVIKIIEDEEDLTEFDANILLEANRQRDEVATFKAVVEKLIEHLNDFDKKRGEAESRATKNFDEKKELEGNVDHQEVLAALRIEHLNFDLTFCETKFPPVKIEDGAYSFIPSEAEASIMPEVDASAPLEEK
ncbi:hypothetical protein Adt_21260 [Abeliophyllum distichum]|uniref:Uncharacterized protein n=1 Tax=Abeliophyllum distichum TaxID=126358 RepID=A0ABD1SYX2_9LAMI